MVRMQFHLTERKARDLRRIAAKAGVSMAEVIRKAVDAKIRRKDPSRIPRLLLAGGGVLKWCIKITCIKYTFSINCIIRKVGRREP